MSQAGSRVPLMAGSGDDVPVEPGDADVVGRWLKLLDVRWSPASVLRLAGGNSAAGVFLLETDGEPCVLKVTASASWRTRAEHELRFYQELAPTLPIPVPELLAVTVVQEGVGLLLSAHGERAAASKWSFDLWREAAAQAGKLHRHCRSDGPPAWLPRAPRPSHVAVTRAVAQWVKLGHHVIADHLPDLLAEVTQVLEQAEPTIIHGDCHVENLLPAEGRLVWVDWQQITTGAGPEDLALLWQRAEFDGARPPRAEMMTAYRDALGTVIDEPLEQLVLAAELRLLLLEWPHFLPYGDERQQETMLKELQDVQHRWGS